MEIEEIVEYINFITPPRLLRFVSEKGENSCDECQKYHGMIFENCRFIKHKDTKDKSVYLARPWRDYGVVTFKDCYLDSHIKEEGFSIWEDTDRHLHARFIEINSTGPGANNNKRISWSKVK